MVRARTGVVQPQDKYVLRLPDGLREELKEAAERHKRSLNAEIIARITEHENLWQFWASADAEMAKLEEVAQKAERLEAENERLQDDLRQLREKLAYQEGMTASLRHGIQVFIKHLSRASDGEPVSLEKIMQEISAAQPSKVKD